MMRHVRWRIAIVVMAVAATSIASSGRLRAQATTSVRFVQWPVFWDVGSGVRIDTVGDPGTPSPAGAVWVTTRQDDPKLIRLVPGASPETDPATWTAWSLASGEQNSEGIAITANDQVFVRTTIGLQRIDPSTNLRTLWPDGFSKSDLAPGSGTSVWTALPFGPVERLVPDGPTSTGATVTRWVAGGSGEVSLAGITVNSASGLVYVSDNGGDAIGELDPATNRLRRWSTATVGVTRPRQISIDRAGDVWAVSKSNHILRLKPSTNELTAYALPAAGDPYGITADGIIGFTEMALGRVGLLIPAGSPVVSAPDVLTVTPTSFHLEGEIDTLVPATGTIAPILTDVPATVSGSDGTGYFIEAAIPAIATGPLGIDRNPSDPPGTYYYADYRDRLIGRVSLPLPEEALVTGGGWIDVPGGKANFSFNAFRKEPGGAVKGTFRYRNLATGDTMQSVELTDLLVYGNNAVFAGTAMIGKIQRTFSVQVSDAGEPGTNDTFRLVTEPGSTVGNTLAGGNIQIHRKH
jgi:streptogramin lyase